MELNYVNELPMGGFDFDNCIRNEALNQHATGGQAIKHKKTGTTICGVVFAGGVVLAADTRATAGSIVANKNCEKLHNLAPNIFCAGAGTAADCDHVTEMVKRQLELHRLNTHTESRVQMAAQRLSAHVFGYGGYIGAYCIIGGYDAKGPQLIEVSADGHSKHGPFLTMGSGSLAAMGIMETEYRENMTEEEAVQLVTRAIEAGVYHDLGSGSNVDCVIMKRGKVDYRRPVKSDNKKVFAKPGGYQFRPEKLVVLEEYRHKLIVEETAAQPMELV